MQTLKLLHTLETKSRFNALLFTEIPPKDGEGDAEEVLCIGTEKGVVEIYSIEVAGDDEDEDDEEDDEEDDDDDMSGPTAIVSLCGKCIGHTNRIKSISALPFPAPEGPTTLLTTVSSDGFINLYDLRSMPATPETELKPVTSYDTKGSRLTTVFIADGGIPKPPKRAVKEAEAVKTKGARFAEPEEESDESDEEEVGEDMYDQSDDEEGSEDGSIEIEYEGEEEEEEEDEEEGEYE